MKASKKKIFISAPISTKWDTVADFSDVLEAEGFEVKCWDRHNKYQQSDLDESDAVVFLLPKNDFRCYADDMPVGLKKELSRAYAQDKPLFVGYVTKSGDYNIYDATSDGRWIEGITGTASNMYRTLREHVSIVSDDRGLIVKDGSGSLYTKNPCAEIELPKAQRVYATTVPNPDYVDERLILMLR